MSHQVMRVKREVMAPCMTCPICHKLFREATTIIECLHTFCRKCINKKLSEEEMECCPVCNIDLGCVPLEKLRLDHNLQDVRAKIFPYKRMKVSAPEVSSPVTLPATAKRKERSLSSLVVSTPRVSSRNMTGRRSKSITRKASRGSSFTIEKSVKKEDSSMEDHHESSSSPETPTRSAKNTRQIASEPSNQVRDQNGSETWEDKVDLWKPLNCLVEAANRSKSSKLSIKGSIAKSEVPNSMDNEGIPNKGNSKENRLKLKVQDVKNFSDNTPPDSERSKKFRKVRQKKAQSFGDFRIPPQAVLDAASARFDSRNYPIWFSLVSDRQEGDQLPLPQIATSYIRIKDGGMPISFIQKYLKLKLNLTCEDEVEIKCMGQAVIPTLTLNNVVDLWLHRITTEGVPVKIGSSAKDLVMVLGYARSSRGPYS